MRFFSQYFRNARSYFKDISYCVWRFKEVLLLYYKLKSTRKMDGVTNNTITVNNKLDGENHYLEQGGSDRRRNENDDDEGASWSIGSSGGMSQSSHDDGVIFQSESIFILFLTSNNSE